MSEFIWDHTWPYLQAKFVCQHFDKAFYRYKVKTKDGWKTDDISWQDYENGKENPWILRTIKKGLSNE